MFSPNQQMPVHANLLSVQVASPTNKNNPMDAFSQAESVVSSSKKLENELLMLGQNIKDYEENIEYLKTRISSLDDQITDLQVALGKKHSSSTHKTWTEEKEATVVEHIMQQHPKSAAAAVCHFKCHDDGVKDVLGVVATLGKVYDDNLSRILSEYLGLDTMLALVCKTYEGVKALEEESSGVGRGRFHAICLEKVRPYAGGFMADDPQRRLALVKPKLPNGQSPPGLLGFAVNMIHIDTDAATPLRETLFYSLFSRLQVYRSRADMLQALPCVSHGAVSLDGAIIRPNGVFVLGPRKETHVRFAVSSYVPHKLAEIENKIKELTWDKETMLETLQIEQPILANLRYTFEYKKQDFVRFMAQTSPYAMQYQIPATPRRTTPR